MSDDLAMRKTRRPKLKAPSPRARDLLIADLEGRPRRRRLRLGTLLWALLTVVLAVGASAQVIRHQAGQIAAWWPDSRPLLERACLTLNCTLPPQRDVGAIAVLRPEIRKHPEVENALLVTAMLRNQAGYAQPLPALELTLFDLTGRPVASRRFTPATYLREGRGHAPMAADAEVDVAIEIMDPGRRAHGFEIALY
ncbi:DUF3426 domain-containing protein [Ectothiorhodospiraceae bacterium 2226]|nr:DUF3426 domain-containing protein [Ectothiorhodospiraceae bacterium 2226]